MKLDLEDWQLSKHRKKNVYSLVEGLILDLLDHKYFWLTKQLLKKIKRINEIYTLQQHVL